MSRLRDLLEGYFSKAKESGVSELDLYDLIAHGLDMTRLQAICAVQEGRALEPAQWDRVKELLDKRLRWMPFSKIVGSKVFCGHNFMINEHVLDPRPETEELVELILGDECGSDSKVLDLGTGSGCILLSLLAGGKFKSGVGVDISPAALEVAASNAAALGLAEKASFVLSNWFERVAGKFDVVVSNPPYVSRTQRCPVGGAHPPGASTAARCYECNIHLPCEKVLCSECNVQQGVESTGAKCCDNSRDLAEMTNTARCCGRNAYLKAGSVSAGSAWSNAHGTENNSLPVVRVLGQDLRCSAPAEASKVPSNPDSELAPELIYDPDIALYSAGPEHYLRIIEGASSFLSPEGRIYFECPVEYKHALEQCAAKYNFRVDWVLSGAPNIIFAVMRLNS